VGGQVGGHRRLTPGAGPDRLRLPARRPPVESGVRNPDPVARKPTEKARIRAWTETWMLPADAVRDLQFHGPVPEWP